MPLDRPAGGHVHGLTSPHTADRDVALLRRHAPTLVLDAREMFRPTEVDGFVAASQLWDRSGVDLGPITTAGLDDRWAPGTYLQFVDDHDRRSLGRDDIRSARRHLAVPRLGRVGLFGRFLDALFQLSVWIRPTTPRRTTAAASDKAQRLELQTHPVCYGRVVRAGEWLVLHYSYFYVMNDWRTSYRGLNDHEADWEQAWVFCDPADESPQWVATSSHDHSGAELRRHWTDPELLIQRTHPTLFVGAGSHALFFRPGDYVTRIDVPGLRWALRARQSIRRLLGIDASATERGLGPALGVAFIDSAGADGDTIDSWEIRPTDDTVWIEQYRGLWGADTGDPLQGERGPSGPKFNRNGSVRTSWADPLGFAGLHGTPPPSAAAMRINRDKLDRVVQELDEQIRHQARLLPLAERADSPRDTSAESSELTALLRQRCELEDLGRRIDRGDRPQLRIREHLRQPAVPIRPGSGWVLAAWSALSIPVLLAAIAAVLLLETVRVEVAAAVLLLVGTPVEYVARREWGAVARLVVAETLLVAFFVFAFGVVLGAGLYALGAVFLAGSAVLLVANTVELRSIAVARRDR